MKLEHFIHIYFDCDFPHLPKESRWVTNRIEFFERFTLPSLLQQTFDDFKIVLFCGKTHRAITSKHEWHPKIIPSYQFGKDVFLKSRADFIAITRIDSDDLFHRAAMADVHKAAQFLMMPNWRSCAIFRHAITWDMANRYLFPRFRKSPPFYTHIYPRAFYMDWRAFKADHFVGHGKAGGRLPNTVELPKGRICVTKNNWNVGLFRRGVSADFMTEKQRDIFLEENKNAIGDEGTIVSILKHFGVENAMEVDPWKKH